MNLNSLEVGSPINLLNPKVGAFLQMDELSLL
jgi:hypothetical protein